MLAGFGSRVQDCEISYHVFLCELPNICSVRCAAYDFMNSDENLFNVTIWYNSTYKNDSGSQPIALTRVPRSINLVCKLLLS